MRNRLLPLLMAFVLMPVTAWAQGSIQGTVTDDTGQPLPGASVAVVETMLGAATGTDGTFRIDGVPVGEQQVTASFVGYVTQARSVTVADGEVSTVNFTLALGVLLEGITVDALGFAVDRDRLTAAQTTVGGEAILRSGETNVMRGLSAKVPGLNITGAGGDPGAGTMMVIRGQTTIQGNNQPLIVIDGQPMANTETDHAGRHQGVQQQSRLNDLNPDDIESVEVLRSASAAALWGSRAQSGVIVITTRSGRAAPRANVSFRSTVSFDEVNQTPDLQSEFGQGDRGMFSFGNANVWGDRIADRQGGDDVPIPGDPRRAVGLQTGNVYFPIASGTASDPHGGKRSQQIFDVNDAFLRTGVYLDNNLSMSAGDANSRYYLSLGHLNQDGIIQGNSDYERTTIRLDAHRQLSPVFGVTGNASYIRTQSDRIQQGSNLAGLLLGAWRVPPDFDNTDWLVNYFPTGTDGAFEPERHRANRNPLGANANPGYDNPLWVVNNNVDQTLVNRVMGRVGASYDPLAWLSFNLNVSADYYADRREWLYPRFTAAAPTGRRQEDNISEFIVGGTLTGRATQPLTDDINLSAMVGFNMNHSEFDFMRGTALAFINPTEFRSLTNAELANITATQGQEVRRTMGAFTELDFDFYDQLFLKATARVDNSSTFGQEARSTFFYPSISAAWQFHQLIDGFEPLSFGKLRASYGIVGREPLPYMGFTYFVGQEVGDGWTSFALLQGAAYGGAFRRSLTAGNPFITPERKEEIEAGIDLRFMDDRVTLGATYYTNQTTDAIFNVATAPSTGFSSRSGNVAVIDNWGVELSGEFRWPTMGQFSWTTYGSWWMNRNTVADLAGVEEHSLGGFVGSTSSLVEGQPFGVIYGDRYRRAPAGCTEVTVQSDCDPLTQAEINAGWTVVEGGLILNDLGFPVFSTTSGVLGDPNPRWRAGFGNTLRYGPVSANVLFDFKIGGDMWNGTRGASYHFGTHNDTAAWTTISEQEANSLMNSQGNTIAALANTWGWQQNTDGSYSFRGFIHDFGAGPVIVDQTWFQGRGGGFNGPTELFVEDAGFVRLREVTLTYNWADATIRGLGLTSVDISLTGRNLITWTDYTGIDPETNLWGVHNAFGLDYYNNPASRSWQVSLRVNY